MSVLRFCRTVISLLSVPIAIGTYNLGKENSPQIDQKPIGRFASFRAMAFNEIFFFFKFCKQRRVNFFNKNIFSVYLCSIYRHFYTVYDIYHDKYQGWEVKKIVHKYSIRSFFYSLILIFYFRSLKLDNFIFPILKLVLKMSL